MATSFSCRGLFAAIAVIGAQAVIFAPAHARVEAAEFQTQPTTTRQVSDSRNPNRQVCNETRITGSRFQRRICRSAADRAAAEKDAEDNLREYQFDGGEAPPPVRLDPPR
jgi:hypothetical protein